MPSFIHFEVQGKTIQNSSTSALISTAYKPTYQVQGKTKQNSSTSALTSTVYKPIYKVQGKTKQNSSTSALTPNVYKPTYNTHRITAKRTHSRTQKRKEKFPSWKTTLKAGEISPKSNASYTNMGQIIMPSQSRHLLQIKSTSLKFTDENHSTLQYSQSKR